MVRSDSTSGSRTRRGASGLQLRLWSVGRVQPCLFGRALFKSEVNISVRDLREPPWRSGARTGAVAFGQAVVGQTEMLPPTHIHKCKLLTRPVHMRMCRRMQHDAPSAQRHDPGMHAWVRGGYVVVWCGQVGLTPCCSQSEVASRPSPWARWQRPGRPRASAEAARARPRSQSASVARQRRWALRVASP